MEKVHAVFGYCSLLPFWVQNMVLGTILAVWTGPKASANWFFYMWREESPGYLVTALFWGAINLTILVVLGGNTIRWWRRRKMRGYTLVNADEESLQVKGITKPGRGRVNAALHNAPSYVIGMIIAGMLFLGLLWYWWMLAYPVAEQMTAAERKSYMARGGAHGKKVRVGVVGGGASGLGASWALSQAPDKFDVMVLEAQPKMGGHAYGYPFPVQDKDGGTKELNFDMGFIFGSPNSYRSFRALLAFYGIGRTKSELSLSASIGDGTECVWATGSKKFPPRSDVERFHKLCMEVVNANSNSMVPFDWWLSYHGFGEHFRSCYILPLASTLFITKKGLFKQSTLFMANMFAGTSRWLDYTKGWPAWVVEGSSRSFYNKMTEVLGDHVHLNQKVTKIERFNEDGKDLVRVRLQNGQSHVFDHLVSGMQAHDLVKVLDASPMEAMTLAQVKADPVSIYLHDDESFLPFEPELEQNFIFWQPAGSSYDDPFELTAPMDLVAKLGKLTPRPVLTMNPLREIKGNVIEKQTWSHHSQDLWHLATVHTVLKLIQGVGNVYYAGDWVTFIGHGRAMATGIDAACTIGLTAGDFSATNDPEHCVDVEMDDLDDQVPLQRICGTRGLFKFVLNEACGRHAYRDPHAPPKTYQ